MNTIVHKDNFCTNSKKMHNRMASFIAESDFSPETYKARLIRILRYAPIFLVFPYFISLVEFVTNAHQFTQSLFPEGTESLKLRWSTFAEVSLPPWHCLRSIVCLVLIWEAPPREPITISSWFYIQFESLQSVQFQTIFQQSQQINQQVC